MERFDPIQLYFRDIKTIPPIPKEEQSHFWRRARRGDKRAQKRIVEANLRLVIPIAKRFFRHGIDFLDLIEEGNMGLMRAVEKFNPRRNVSFSTYATYWIDQAVRRAIEEQVKTIRIPPHVWDALGRLSKNMRPMQEKLGRNPTLLELSKRLDLTVKQTEKLLTASKISQGASSLETPIDAEGNIFIRDVISDKKSASPESITELLRQHSDIDQALSYLEPRERQIIELRFGLNGKEPESLEEVGKHLKLSRERVRQLEERCIKRLKSLAIKVRLIDISDGKYIMADSRQEKKDRRLTKPDRRQRKPDTRRVKLERRKTLYDRRHTADRRKNGKLKKRKKSVKSKR